MKIIILNKSIVKHDAIGNDIEVMYKILNENYKCVIFSEYPENDNLSYISEQALNKELPQKDNIYIYHHSLMWQMGERILKKIEGKIIFRFHNITPSQFFTPYDVYQGELSEQGIAQTLRYIKTYKNAIWMPDSEFNVNDIPGVAREKIIVCYPFQKIEEWAKTKDNLSTKSKLINSGKINLLFVGRIVPNKGYLFLLRCLKVFIMSYHSNIKLNIIGKFNEGLVEYNKRIIKTIQEYELQNNIEFIGEITDEILATYYRNSDFFVCASDHEGFGVPLVEAQYFKLPIIALNKSAVPETIGKEQLVLDKSPKEFAAAISILNKNKQYYEFLSQKGSENYSKRYSYAVLKNIFGRIVKNIVVS